MADHVAPSLSDCLKEFAQKITTPSVKERLHIFRQLTSCIGKSEIPEKTIQGIVKYLLLTAGVYRDNRSRHAVLELLQKLSTAYPQPTLKCLVTSLTTWVDAQTKLIPFRALSGSALYVLTWTCVSSQPLLKTDLPKPLLKQLVYVQCGLVSVALSAHNTVISTATYRKMAVLWTQFPALIKDYSELTLDGEPPNYHICMMSLLLKYLARTKRTDDINTIKAKCLEFYLKQVLGSRTICKEPVLSCCQELLKHITHEDFKEKVLPAAQKAMLRNPEIILTAVTSLVDGVAIDLSQYALDIGKMLASQLSSKDEGARAEAGRAAKYLAKQCSDPDALEKLTEHFFKVLNGCEGKLSLAAQKISVIQGVGNLSHHTVSGANAVHNLSSSVVELFLPVLQQEVQEQSLIHTVSMMSLWCNKFHTTVPDKLIEWFKKAPSLKTSTSSVRHAYLLCMGSTFKGDTLLLAAPLMPVLLQTLEKASNQSSQPLLVMEAVAAMCILIRLAAVDITAESKLGPFWNIVLDVNKQLVVNDKFLSNASEEALLNVVNLSERLILDHPHKLTEKSARSYYKALVYCLTRPQWNIRRQASAAIHRATGLLGGAQISLSLITEFKEMFSKQKYIDPELLLSSGDGEGVTSPDGATRYVKPQILAQGLTSICRVEKADPKDGANIARESLLIAHHPCIVVANRDLWVELIAGLGLDIGHFLAGNGKSCLQMILEQPVITEDHQSAVGTLIRIAGEEVAQSLLGYISESLGNSDLTQVTLNDYEIFLTPPGQLWDNTIVESAGKVVQDANVKRESKLYSYEDQMAEKELKKELDKKKKNVVEKPKLSKKQEEMVQLQLEKESVIRERLNQLDKEVSKCCLLIEGAVNGSHTVVGYQMVPLFRLLKALLKSPLAAPHVYRSLVRIGEAAFIDLNQPMLGCLVSNTTVRVLKPQCSLAKSWSEEELVSQVTRALRRLEQLSLPSNTDDDDSSVDDTATRLPATTFAFCFHLLAAVISQGGSLVKGDETLRRLALNLIIEHAQIRSTSNSPTLKSSSDPAYLPRREMLSLLCPVLGMCTGKLQQLVATAILEVSKSASGGAGCTRAQQDEIDVLLEGLLSPCVAVRETVLHALLSLLPVLPTLSGDYDNGLMLLRRVFIATHDTGGDVQKLAQRLIAALGISEPPAELCIELIEDVLHDEAIVRQSTALMLAEVTQLHPDYIASVILLLLEKYEEKLYMPPPVLDQFGRLVEEQPPDMWPARSGIALTLEKLSPHLPQEEIEQLFGFFVPKALADRNEEVRGKMRNAALAVVNDHGKENVSLLLPIFEELLGTAPDTASMDAVRQSVVILLGSLAKHLERDNPKIKPIVAKLIGALSTPSQQVQEAVANCLPPLVPSIKDDALQLVQKLLQLLLESDTYGERKGAAYGLAGLVKGLGILALKQLSIMETLTEAVQNKKNPRHREGALFAFEMLCTMLGKLFEPYVVHIVRHLLLCFGDSNQYVREAADDTARAVMSKLSAHGVKLVLPSLLKGLEEDAWRTKSGSVELLGAMAYCAPKQLSACLPSIVPKLTEVLTDSHQKVQKAGAQALKQIGSVIRNPEIQAISPILLDALQEPTKKTTVCLQTLLETQFVHFIDAPSLALIMPVVQRAFQDRSTETRKMAAQIIGNMYSLTDQKDLSPYLPSVIPGLKQSLLDPVPEVRSVSSRALGAMVKGMGEASFDDLLPWLMKMLTSESSSVDRSGAAQGLSEVIGGMGLEKLNKLMPDIIQTAERVDIAPHVRDGYVMMYIFLPSVFSNDFVPYVGPILPSILLALADESEFVRDTALRAGQRIISLYSDTAIELLLPELERGLFDDNWRIRYSSVQLLGDLLYKVSGVSGKMTTESASEDDNFGTETSQKAIMRTLGFERSNRVLAGLYMGRSDTALMVRQSALHVWKIIVSNTPRTLREILGTLFQLLLGCLASNSYDKRQVAGRTLGDLVKKLGERVLPEIIPILERGLDSDQKDQRQGVCIGLSEIMAATNREHVTVFADSLIPSVQRALRDPLPEVREAAARTFDNLHSNIGQRAIDDILPQLLSKLGEGEESEYALDGLKQVISVKSRVVLPYLVPQLVAPPVNSRALSLLSSVAGESLSRHLGKILPALLIALGDKAGTPDEAQELQYCQTVVLSVIDEVGVRTVLEDLLSAATSTPSTDKCFAAVTILQSFCRQTKADYSDYVPMLFRGLLSLFNKTDKKVLVASWNCLDAVTKTLDTSEMLQHIVNVRQAVKFATSDNHGQELPGFCLPKGLTPLLPIFREGILNGSPDMKESAAIGLGELIKLTSAEALKPSVINITGPLIRILGDRFTHHVKVALLETLSLLLAKVGVMLKPFLPQLQTTFVKALNDPNRSVRLKAAAALGKLIVIHVRVDPLFTEIINSIKAGEGKSGDDTGTRETLLQALRGCITGAGHKMSEAIRGQVETLLLGLLSDPADVTRMAVGGCIGALCRSLPDEELTQLLIQNLLDVDPSLDWTLRHGRSVALFVALKEAPERLLTNQTETSVKQTILQNIQSDRIHICLSGLRAAGYVLKYEQESKIDMSAQLTTALLKGMKHDSNEVKQLAAQLLNFISQSTNPLSVTQVKGFIPMLLNGSKEKNTTVRVGSEYALISILKLRHGEHFYQEVLSNLDVGLRDSLKEVTTKSLKKLSNLPQPMYEEIDDSLVT